MILYSVVTLYQLLNAVVHSAQGDRQGVLVISQWIKQKFPDLQKLHSFFYKVCTLDATYGFYHSQQETKDYYEAHIGVFEDYSEIYVWGAQFSFGNYLAEQKIPFCYGEEAAGILSRPEVLEEIEAGDPHRCKFYKHIKELGLYNGENWVIKKKLCNLSAQTGSFIADEKTVNLDLVQELNSMPETIRKAIIDIFLGEKHISLASNSTLLLTQHFANLKAMSFEQQVLVYQLFTDYFFGGKNLVIKLHPDDLMYYGQLFPKARIIREKFPSEFIPFIFDNQPNCVATISSTAIYNLRGHYPKVFELDSRYEKDFPMTHRYFAAVKTAAELALNIVCLGANELLAQKLCETLVDSSVAVSCDLNFVERPCVLLIDDITASGEEGRTLVQETIERLHPDSIAMFINSKGDYCWYHYDKREMWEHIVPMVLTKTAIEPRSEDFYSNLDDEVVYVYSKNEELLKMVKELSVEKTLPHTGVEIKTGEMTAEQERIKILEGILAATERRLLYYIEKEKAQK